MECGIRPVLFSLLRVIVVVAGLTGFTPLRVCGQQELTPAPIGDFAASDPEATVLEGYAPAFDSPVSLETQSKPQELRAQEGDHRDHPSRDLQVDWTRLAEVARRDLHLSLPRLSPGPWASGVESGSGVGSSSGSGSGAMLRSGVASSPGPTPTGPQPATGSGSEPFLVRDRLADPLTQRPTYRLQGVVIQEGDETSGRGRATLFWAVRDNVLLGAEVDITGGEGFSQDGGVGIDLNELYAAYSPPRLPELRLVAGLMDLTGYFDRNSFAKDRATHFFNGVFQTNPALSAAGIASRPGFLLNWSPIDALEVKGVVFSSNRGPSNLNLDAYAGEVGVRLGTVIVRGTYVSAKDGGRDSGFREIFGLRRDNGEFGIADGDREEAFGLNAEASISKRLGLFGRYGSYRNQELDESGSTYSLGLNLLDLWREGDRLGIGYGRQLSNDGLRRDRGDRTPDVLETFYDLRLNDYLRGAVTIQGRDGFSEWVFGARVRADF